jgi:sugar (pentulose or hexulose) kinase
MDIKQAIKSGNTSLGIEFGSTRIKAVLIGEDFTPIASGSHEWENRLENGLWTYYLGDVWTGLQRCYDNLTSEIKKQFDLELTKIGSIGISAMMHGYLVFDKDDKQLAPFRTWRNTITEQASNKLRTLFNYNIPQRWSIAHLYQSMLNNEPYLADVAFMTTLAGYVHWKLTGEKKLGLGDASGMFPVDSETCYYHSQMLEQFEGLKHGHGFPWKLADILPKALKAGENAGTLSAEGVKLLDSKGILQAGIPFCPPEGDAGTGMVATNSVRQRTGNISAGTSIFAMVVLEKDLSQVYQEIDIVATPDGKPVAMVHCNNCSTDLDAWIKVFHEAIELTGGTIDKPSLYAALYNKALSGDADCGGLISYNYYSGEHITGFDEGRPLFTHLPDSRFNLANFMRCLLFSTLSSMRIGMDILTKKENVQLDGLLGHGGIFKTKGVAQQLMAAALETPISVMDSAGEGGAWGISLLAAFMRQSGSPRLEDFLEQNVFANNAGQKINPNPQEVKGFREYMKRYEAGLNIERAAVDNLK